MEKPPLGDWGALGGWKIKKEEHRCAPLAGAKIQNNRGESKCDANSLDI
ncbi:hypothetical protein HMPREF1146_1424 [Prevotella sp. MSX73]|jgi:hypothetical protein|nr:hypothetical protein HMPREF0649_00668 [Segatella buccae D17]EJP32764.1 hypothetical protein HMPREF1146_1424 [Prevotella sp. MSX73]